MDILPVSDPAATESPSTDERFGIADVSRLTGISDHALRVWERRYQVVDPGRTESRRREYTREDIRRLSLIKTLVDSGQSIRHLAHLPMEALEARLRETHPALPEPVAPLSPGVVGPIRIAFAGNLSGELLRAAVDDAPACRLVGTFASLDALAAAMRPGAVDLLIVECPNVFEAELAAIQAKLAELRTHRGIVIYRFARPGLLDAAGPEDRRLTALRAPVSADELRLACLAGAPVMVAPPTPGGREASPPPLPGRSGSGTPPRLYSDDELARIARHSSVVRCECPQHLANLLASLAAFESYSAECAHRDPEDAELHAYLHRVSGECRAEMEAALSHLMEHEGIRLS